MSDFLDNAAIDIPCPGCGHKHHKTFAWLKANDHIACVCGADIALDKSNFTGPVQKVEDSLADLKRTIRKLGR